MKPTPIKKTPRWYLMEQFEAIADREPVFPGDLISKKHTKLLEEARLVMRNDEGDFELTPNGRYLYHFWKTLPEEF